MNDSLEDLDSSIRDHIYGTIENTSLTPGVLTVETATMLDSSVDLEESVRRGAGVQMSYEGLELTRSILHESRWDAGERTSYYLDLLAAEILVSRGFYYLSNTGVATDSVDIVQRFSLIQTNKTTDQLGTRDDTEPLEIDFLRLAMNAGVDQVLGSVSPEIWDAVDELAREIEAYPLPAPDAILPQIEPRLSPLVNQLNVREQP